MPLVLTGATSGSTTLQSTDAVTAVLTLPSTTGTLHDENSTLLSSKLSGALPAIDGSALTGISGGKVLQVVSTTKTDEWSTTSTSYVDVTGLSVTITPTSATSKILVTVQVAMGGSESSTWSGGQMRLYRDATSIGESTATTGSTAGANFGSGSGQHTRDIYATWTAGGGFLDSPSTTTATTYKVKLAAVNYGSTTVYLNRAGTSTNNFSGVGSSTITVMEIGA